MPGVLADVGFAVPAALAFLAVGFGDTDFHFARILLRLAKQNTIQILLERRYRSLSGHLKLRNVKQLAEGFTILSYSKQKGRVASQQYFRFKRLSD